MLLGEVGQPRWSTSGNTLRSQRKSESRTVQEVGKRLSGPSETSAHQPDIVPSSDHLFVTSRIRQITLSRKDRSRFRKDFCTAERSLTVGQSNSDRFRSSQVSQPTVDLTSTGGALPDDASILDHCRRPDCAALRRNSASYTDASGCDINADPQRLFPATHLCGQTLVGRLRCR